MSKCTFCNPPFESQAHTRLEKHGEDIVLHYEWYSGTELKIMGILKVEHCPMCGRKLTEDSLVEVPGKPLQVFLKGDSIIITGIPDDEEDEEFAHNCDAMGCGSVEHIIFRGHLADWMW